MYCYKGRKHRGIYANRTRAEERERVTEGKSGKEKNRKKAAIRQGLWGATDDVRLSPQRQSTIALETTLRKFVLSVAATAQASRRLDADAEEEVGVE